MLETSEKFNPLSEREITPEEKSGIALVSELQQNGFEAYFVGGCVRDLLLGENPKDFDIATNAEPDKVEEIFKQIKALNIIPVGRAYGVIKTLINGDEFEIATFREDIGFTGDHKTGEVKFSSKEFDASRRDFTINGLFFDPIKKEVYDFVGGENDLENKIIKFIGNPDERIKEDSLRLLRAIRFKNRMNFQYDSPTWQALENNAERINLVSKERVADELNKILKNENRAQALLDMKENGLLRKILPELTDLENVEQPKEYHGEGNAWVHALKAVESLDKKTPLPVVWAVLLHDIGKKPASDAAKGQVEKIGHRKIYFPEHEKYSAEMARQILRRLKFSNDFIAEVDWLIANHMLFLQLDKMRVGKQRAFLQHPLFSKLLQVFHADISGSIPTDFSSYEFAKKLYEEELARPQEERQKEIIDGKTIIETFNIAPGPEIGRLKKLAQDAYMETRIKTKEEALELIARTLKNPSFR